METAVFIVAAVMVIAGALGVVLRPNPVHCALSLVLTLFGFLTRIVRSRPLPPALPLSTSVPSMIPSMRRRDLLAASIAIGSDIAED